MPLGRPLKFSTPQELESKANEYFDTTLLTEQTITGLALHLETSRETLCNYEEKDDFFDTVKKLKDRIEHAYELRGMKTGGAFDIFRLKNMGWRDKVETGFTNNKGDDIQPIVGMQIT